MSTITKRPLAHDMICLIGTILSPKRQRKLAEKLGYTPTRSECVRHFITSGQLARFRQRNQILTETAQ